MKLLKLALSAALATACCVGNAAADDLVRPASVYSTTFDYYQDEAAPSPSDLPVAPEAEDATPSLDYGSISLGGCTDGCDSGCTAGCDSGCDGGCTSGCCSSHCLGLGSCLDGLFGDCCLGEPWNLFNETCGVQLSGHFQAGYHSNANGLFNDHPDRVNIHQWWLTAEKAAEGTDCCWDWGFRTDIMYGVDAADTQAFGNNPGRWDFMNGFDHGIYGWALPQAYLEFDRGDLNIIAGHFYTLVGYEVVPATGNFFYSHAYTMYNSEPFTHTGVLASYDYNDCLTLYAGWTLGWDTGFDRFDNGSTFLGGFAYQVFDDLSFTYITTFGDFGQRAGDGYSHSIVIDAQLTDSLNYVFQSDLVSTDVPTDSQIGINQYLFYTLNDCWAVGGRFEWWNNDGEHTYEATAGVNYRPHANVVFRPEVRHDWIPSTDFEQTTFGVDMVLTY